ncbi:MAG TPA: histone deacetylase family protein [Planctomycetota bacterium]|nr:histone deacetylase family protein [Planctomycetota bacterium]
MFKIFYSNGQADHLTETVNGAITVAPHPESPRRPGLIRDALVNEFSAPVITPAAAGIQPGAAIAAIDAVHAPAYRIFIEKICADLVPGEFFIPSGGVRNKLELDKAPIRKQAGFYNFGGDTPVSRQTHAAAIWSVEAALAGVGALLAGEKIAFALCRPPGHHAEHDRYGGFCFFGNAAIAADQLARRGALPGAKHAKVAVIDVDYHHGNGTQHLLFERFDTFYLSLHGDPRYAYPHFSGWPDEVGRGAGEGFNLNLPLPHDTDKTHYLATLSKGLDAVREFGPEFVIISLGFDIHKNDPVGGLGLETGDFRDIALALKSLDRPTLVVLEGGYSEPDLGPSACAFFSAWM